MTVKEYLDACVSALDHNTPLAWPAYQTNPEGVWRYIARNIGHGLQAWPEAEWTREINSLYSRVLVVHAFHLRGGVTVNAKTFNGWILTAAREVTL